jgi:hypothetical protein
VVGMQNIIPVSFTCSRQLFNPALARKVGLRPGYQPQYSS